MPPKTLKIEDISDILDSKLEDMKKKLINELRENIMEDLKNEIKDMFVSQQNIITTLESTVVMLQEHVTILKGSNENLLERIDENEQYGRRLCLRIEDVETAPNESSQDVLEKVHELIQKTENCDIPSWSVDRAHRIGKKYINKHNKKEVQSIIVRFVTFNHRTSLYRVRKSIKDGIRIKLDLTKKRYDILSDAIDVVEKVESIKFVYADINCRLKFHPKEGPDQFFSSIADLKSKISELEK